MSRFGRLELDGRRGVPPTQSAPARALSPTRQPEHDERYWLAAALEERRAGLHENALRYYSRALEMDKSLVAGWVGQVQMLIAVEEYPEAELWSRKALELFKNNADLLSARSQALCRTGDLKNAQAISDAAISQPGQFSYPWVARGELMIARKQEVDGYCFDKATVLDTDWLVSLEIGEIYLYHDQPTKALRRIVAAVEKAPGSAYCWYRQGVCQQRLGLTAAARKSFERCLNLSPHHVLATRELAQTHTGRNIVMGYLRKYFPLG